MPSCAFLPSGYGGKDCCDECFKRYTSLQAVARSSRAMTNWRRLMNKAKPAAKQAAEEREYDKYVAEMEYQSECLGHMDDYYAEVAERRNAEEYGFTDDDGDPSTW